MQQTLGKFIKSAGPTNLIIGLSVLCLLFISAYLLFLSSSSGYEFNSGRSGKDATGKSPADNASTLPTYRVQMPQPIGSPEHFNGRKNHSQPVPDKHGGGTQIAHVPTDDVILTLPLAGGASLRIKRSKITATYCVDHLVVCSSIADDEDSVNLLSDNQRKAVETARKRCFARPKRCANTPLLQ